MALQWLIDGGKLVEDAKMKPVFTELGTFPEICYWKREAKQRKRTIVYNIYRKENISSWCSQLLVLWVNLRKERTFAMNLEVFVLQVVACFNMNLILSNMGVIWMYYDGE